MKQLGLNITVNRAYTFSYSGNITKERNR